MDNKIKKYLDKVISYLLSEIDLRYDGEEIIINAPFFIPDGIKLKDFRYVDVIFYEEFLTICRNIYGLTKEESLYVLDMCLQNIKNKIISIDNKLEIQYQKLFSDWGDIYKKKGL